MATSSAQFALSCLGCGTGWTCALHRTLAISLVFFTGQSFLFDYLASVQIHVRKFACIWPGSNISFFGYLCKESISLSQGCLTMVVYVRFYLSCFGFSIISSVRGSLVYSTIQIIKSIFFSQSASLHSSQFQYIFEDP